MTPAIELQAPDIGRWRAGNCGVDFVWSFDSGRPGHHVMVQALTHGNELCGAIALDWLLGQHVPLAPPKGRLTLVFANVAAYAAWDAQAPDRSRFVDEDFNRVWADEVLFGTRDTVELRRARELAPFVDAADFLLDIHSMREPCRPIMVCGDGARGGDKAAAFARRLQVPAVLLVDTGHAAGRRMIDRGAFGAPEAPSTAVLIECGQHWERAAAAVALDTLLRFLQLTGAATEALLQAHAQRLQLPVPAAQQLVRVTHAVVAKTEHFRFARAYQGLEVIARAGETIAHDGETVIRTPYDDAVLVMPSPVNARIGDTMVRLGRMQALA